MKELKISELSSSNVVCGGKVTPIGQHISNTAEDEKSIPHLNIDIGHGRL